MDVVVFSPNPKVEWLSLGSSGKAHAVVGAVIHRVVRPEEYISQNPQGLSILRGQVGGGDANAASISILVQTDNKRIH